MTTYTIPPQFAHELLLAQQTSQHAYLMTQFFQITAHSIIGVCIAGSILLVWRFVQSQKSKSSAA
ncbi:MAG TPA: hypothetical protein VHG71_10210 [Verrucomicrobiae bacterium]|nr:hypothetical protein [Verrucomicrobiae bacterium]